MIELMEEHKVFRRLLQYDAVEVRKFINIMHTYYDNKRDDLIASLELEVDGVAETVTVLSLLKNGIEVAEFTKKNETTVFELREAVIDVTVEFFPLSEINKVKEYFINPTTMDLPTVKKLEIQMKNRGPITVEPHKQNAYYALGRNEDISNFVNQLKKTL